MVNVLHAGEGRRWRWQLEELAATFHMLAKAGGGKNQCLGQAMGEVIDVPEVLKSGSIFQAATKKDSNDSRFCTFYLLRLQEKFASI
jgi:hypothetical protein